MDTFLQNFIFIAPKLITELLIKECYTIICVQKPSSKKMRMLTRINPLKPTGYLMEQYVLTFNNCTLCPHRIYVFCIYLRTNSDLCHLQHKLMVFITEMKSVYCAVRAGSLYIILRSVHIVFMCFVFI